MEKDAAGSPLLPMHHGLTNPGTSRTSPAAYPTSCPEIDVEAHLRERFAVDEILAEAEEAHVDLIVMGTHGRSGLGRVLLGSIAKGVMRKSRLPVLTTKNPLVPGATEAMVKVSATA
jgi:hypothetical protein